MRYKAKMFIPSDAKIKGNTFIVTKPQLSMLMEIHTGDYKPILASKRQSMEVFFICSINNCVLNKQTMLALHHKYLIRLNYRTLTYELTNLGKRLMKQKMKNPTKSGIVHAVFSEKNVTKTLILAAQSGNKFKY